jgi:hypothetical protein
MDRVIDPATGELMEDTALGLGVYTDTKLVILGLAGREERRRAGEGCITAIVTVHCGESSYLRRFETPYLI